MRLLPIDCFFLAADCSAQSGGANHLPLIPRQLTVNPCAGICLGHHLKGEEKRLALMSELLDPVHRRYLQSLDVIKSGARTLEVGCGNGSISAWLARQVAPDGRAIAVISIFRSSRCMCLIWSFGRRIL